MCFFNSGTVSSQKIPMSTERRPENNIYSFRLEKSSGASETLVSLLSSGRPSSQSQQAVAGGSQSTTALQPSSQEAEAVWKIGILSG